MAKPTASTPDAPATRVRLRVTRTGWHVTFLSLAVALAAANTANNLLYLLLALLLAAYVTGAWFSWRSVAALKGGVVAPLEVRPGAATDVVVTLEASGRAASGLLAEIRATEAGGAAAVVSPRPVSHVAEGESAAVAVPVELRRRGAASLGLVARSPFPFGLVESRRPLAAAEVLVLPEPDPAWRQAVPESVTEGAAAPRKGEGTDIFNIREYAPGEDARRMDWKASARVGKPMLREHAREQLRHAVIVLTPGARPPARRGVVPEDPALERAVSLAAGAAEDLGREGWALRLLAPGMEVRGDARAILRGLARFEAPAEAPAEGWWRGRVAPGESVLEVAAAGGASVRATGGVA